MSGKALARNILLKPKPDRPGPAEPMAKILRLE